MGPDVPTTGEPGILGQQKGHSNHRRIPVLSSFDYSEAFLVTAAPKNTMTTAEGHCFVSCISEGTLRTQKHGTVPSLEWWGHLPQVWLGSSQGGAMERVGRDG